LPSFQVSQRSASVRQDILHRENLERVLPRFKVEKLAEPVDASLIEADTNKSRSIPGSECRSATGQPCGERVSGYVGRCRDIWVASSHLKNHVIAEPATVFKAALAEQGKPAPADFPVLRNIVVGPDRGTVIRDVGAAIAESYRIFGNWGLFNGVVGDAKIHPEFEDLIADRFIIGSPEQCAVQITDLMRSTGCNRLVARIQWVGMEHTYVMRTIELLGNEVAPLVREALA
jgi:hypothetical protein